MFTNPFFYTTIALAGVLTYSLGHNITTGAALRKGLGAEWKKQLAKWKAQ